MKTALFPQSEMQDPYAFYDEILANSPVWWDDVNKIWAVYPYDYCNSILNHPLTAIPPVSTAGFDPAALVIASNLVRLSNAPQHASLRDVTMGLFHHLQPVETSSLIHDLIWQQPDPSHFDWTKICKKLPLLHLLEGFRFDRATSNHIAALIPELVYIMLPQKTPDQLVLINKVSTELYNIIETHLYRNTTFFSIIQSFTQSGMNQEDVINCCVSNITGLLIQSYDALRGLLSLVLLYYLEHKEQWKPDLLFLQRAVTELLRFDPPIHNTRRIATGDFSIDDITIKQGERILLILAAANRDPRQFVHAHLFDTDRTNNDQALTFGTGVHACIARHFSVELVATSMYYLLTRYKSIQLADDYPAFEPLVNARIPCSFKIKVL
ncbi:MAG: cytochrome P450 [Chitinophagaceae bacterium]